MAEHNPREGRAPEGGVGKPDGHRRETHQAPVACIITVGRNLKEFNGQHGLQSSSKFCKAFTNLQSS